MEALPPEVEPFGIRTMIVEPGFFRTELLQPESTTYAELWVDDYAPRTEQTLTAWQGMNGQQAGDPVKLARGLVQLASSDEPPLRWLAGAMNSEAAGSPSGATSAIGRSPTRS